MTATTAPAYRTDKHGFPVETCSRCIGAGRIPAFGNVYGGVCFGCQGSGVRYPKGTVATNAAKFAQELRAARSAQLNAILQFDADGSRQYVTFAAPGDEVRYSGSEEWRTIASIRITRRVAGWGCVGERLVHLTLDTVVTFTDGTTTDATSFMWQRRPNQPELLARRADLVAQAVAAYTATLARRAKRAAA